MILKPIDSVDVRALSIAQVEAYLQEAGWKKIVPVNPRALPYEGPLDIYGKPITVVLPASKEFVDADRRLNEVISVLSKVEAITPARLVQVMLSDGTRQTRVRTRSVMVKKPKEKSAVSG